MPHPIAEEADEDVEGARKWMQELVDTADDEEGMHKPPPNFEDDPWTKKQEPPKEEERHAEYVNNWSEIRHNYREPFAEWLGVRRYHMREARERVEPIP